MGLLMICDRPLTSYAFFVCIIRVSQKYAANRESMDMLQKNINSMNIMIRSASQGGWPQNLEDHLRIFSEYVQILIFTTVTSLTREMFDK